MRNDAGQLCRDRDQKGLFAFIKAAQVMLLYYQDTQHTAMMDDRHPEEGMETLLTG